MANSNCCYLFMVPDYRAPDFFKHNYPPLKANCLDLWEQREDKNSAYALFIRRELISAVFIQMNRSVAIIKVLIALCPLLGLLGTVTGMIHVFDVMAVTGTGNARAMASGVSLKPPYRLWQVWLLL